MEKRESTIVRLQSASLDDKEGQIVAHGWLDITAINNLRVGDYQREILENRGGKRSSLRNAAENHERLPDIMLGMRGQKYNAKGDDMLLENDVYIIDGLQRVSALRKFAADHPDEIAKVRIGAEVRFNTTRDSETDLFTVLNVSRKAMSPAVILRNARNSNEGIATLYGLSMHDRNFALVGKVCWDQQMHRGELMTALTFVKSAITLQRHVTTGTRQVTSRRNVAEVCQRVAKTVGLQTFRANLTTMYYVMDEVWGVRGIKYQDRVTHLRANFLIQMAGVFSDHEDFWDGNRLMVDADFRRKLKTFPLEDPSIIRLAGGGNSVGELLRRHIIDHLNKNKQASRHLVLRRIEPYRKDKAKKDKD